MIHQPAPIGPRETIVHKFMLHNAHQPFNRHRRNFVRENLVRIQAGQAREKRIDPAARANNPHYAQVFGGLDDELTVDPPEQDKRSINEMEFYGAIVRPPKTKEEIEKRARMLRNVVDAKIVQNGKTVPMQVGVEGCAPMSKLSRVVSGVSMSIKEKYERILKTSDAYEYKRPDTPPYHRRNLEQGAMKGRRLLE